MEKRSRILLSMSLLLTCSCSTLSDSLKLGAGLGAMTGAAATYTAHSTSGQQPAFGDVALGAGIGMGIGLLTSYVVHRQVESDRSSAQNDGTQMFFGDLPPSPFIVPQPKKGSK